MFAEYVCSLLISSSFNLITLPEYWCCHSYLFPISTSIVTSDFLILNNIYISPVVCIAAEKVICCSQVLSSPLLFYLYCIVPARWVKPVSLEDFSSPGRQGPRAIAIYCSYAPDVLYVTVSHRAAHAKTSWAGLQERAAVIVAVKQQYLMQELCCSREDHRHTG